jgi:hypothetical protein
VFHITIECSTAFAAHLAKGSVVQNVYASKSGGINFRTATDKRMHVDNSGFITER